MTGLHYPDNLYADHEEAKARRLQQPVGAYRYTDGAGSPPYKPGVGYTVDPVTKPAHYQRAGIETIDYIRATLDGPGFEAYCIGNVLKYVSRYREKGGAEDLRKAQVYLGWAIQPTSGNRPNQPEACNPAAMREAKIAYDVATEQQRSAGGVRTSTGAAWSSPSERVAAWGGGMPPKWHPDYVRPPNCDGLSARDIRSPHPMSAEAIRDHDERLAGGEDRL